MNNSADIQFDGVNVYVNLSIKVDRISNIMVAGFNIIAISLFVLLVSAVEKQEVGKFIIPFAIMSILIIFFPLRYMLWNFFGKEILIVNTKCISWAYNYGFFKTNLKKIPFRRIATSYEFVRESGGIDFGRLQFINYSPLTNLPVTIHTTSVLAPKGDIEKIQNAIEQLFYQKDNSSISFSPN